MNGDVQITNFLNTLMNFANTSMILHDVLASKGLEIVAATPISALIADSVLVGIDPTPSRDGTSIRDRCKQYLITELTLIKRRYLLTHNHNLRDSEIIQRIPALIQKWITTDSRPSAFSPIESSVSIVIDDAAGATGATGPNRSIDLTQVPVPSVPKKSNKEQGLIQFVALCQPIKTITSSVDLYNGYRRFCSQNGYGYYSSPTLTKYLRCSDKRPLESVSEKGRSQGWYLQMP